MDDQMLMKDVRDVKIVKSVAPIVAMQLDHLRFSSMPSCGFSVNQVTVWRREASVTLQGGV